MSKDYSSQKVFVEALVSHNFGTIKLCQAAGQDVNQVMEYTRNSFGARSIFLEMLSKRNIEGLQACVAVGNIDFAVTNGYGFTCLMYCSDAYRLSVCLELGADIHKQIEGRFAYVGNAFAFQMLAKKRDVARSESGKFAENLRNGAFHLGAYPPPALPPG